LAQSEALAWKEGLAAVGFAVEAELLGGSEKDMGMLGIEEVAAAAAKPGDKESSATAGEAAGNISTGTKEA
jgi:hypothetical protein